MSSDELSESEVSRFTLDGVVAEMVIEVDENNEAIVSPSKSLKLDKYLKKSSSLEDNSEEKIDTEDSSRSASDSGDNGNPFTESEKNLLEDIDSPFDKEINVDDDQLQETSKKEEELVLEVTEQSEKESDENISDYEEKDDNVPEEKFETESSASDSNISVPFKTNQDQKASEELSEEELFSLNASEEKDDNDSNASSEKKEKENSFEINKGKQQIHNQKVQGETSEEKLSNLNESEERCDTDSNGSIDKKEKEVTKVSEESSRKKSDVDELEEKEPVEEQESDTSLGETKRKSIKLTIDKKESHSLEVSEGESEENVSDLEKKSIDSEEKCKTLPKSNSDVKKKGRPFQAMKQKHYEDENVKEVKSDLYRDKESDEQETESNTNSGINKRKRSVKTTKQKKESQHENDDKESDTYEKDEEDKQGKESDTSSSKKKVVRKVPVQVAVVSTSSTGKKEKLTGPNENNDKEPQEKQQKDESNSSIKKRGRPFKSSKSEADAMKRKVEEEKGSKEKKTVLDKSMSKESQENLENSIKKKRGRPFSTTKHILDIKRTALPPNKKSELLNSPRFRTRPSLQNEKNKASENSTPKGNLKRKATDSKEETEVSEKKLKSVSKDTTEGRRGRKSNTVSDKKSGSEQSKKQSLKSSSLSRLDSLLTSRLKLYTLKYGDKPSLSSFPEIKENVETANMRSLRYMHRVLYDRWAPKVEEEVKAAVLGFNGFSFNRKSDDFEIRQQLLTKMPNNFIDDICKILDLKEGKSKSAEILKFLLKPSKSIMSPVDPSEAFMQPVLKLEKITFDNKYLKKAKEVSNKRKRFPSVKLEMYVDPSSVIGRPSVSEKPQSSSTSVERKKQSAETPKTSEEEAPQQQKGGFSHFTDQKLSLMKKRKLELKKKSSQDKDAKKGEKADSNAREKAVELAQRIKETENPPNSSSDDDVYVPLKFHTETVIKQEPIAEDDSTDYMPSVDNSNENEDSSSEVTLSADEAKEESKHHSMQKKRILYRRVGKPLTCFNKVKENVLTGGFSALQRLHILLFGSSDKAENLKSNILAFGGFPFLEGSDEWKQKEFLLSLVAQNTLREYLILLDIKHTYNDDQRTLITKLMKFLAIPSDSADIETITKVISSEPTGVSQVPKITGSVYDLPKSRTEKKKDAPKKKGNKPNQRGFHKRAKKVLMDENQVRRMEADLAREQRILERERKLNMEKSKKLLEKMGQFTASTKVQQPTESTDYPPWRASLNKAKVLSKNKIVTPQEKQSDVELLNALLETVRQRRALQSAGAIVSIPNRGQTRLGDLDNVKFLVVTANYNDLDVLHYLIYMSDASKHRVRKNILDFAGFNFTEESPAYKERINFMDSLGYDITKRIGFLLGLCPFKAKISAQDLNELIMYFLMSPCQTKQVPIKHLPQNFFNNDMPEELCNLLKKHAEEDVTPVEPLTVDAFEYAAAMQTEVASPETQSPSTSKSVVASPRKKAKKSFKSCLPPSQIKGLTPSISTLPLKAPTTLRKLPSKLGRPTAAMKLTPSLSSILTPSAALKLQQTPTLVHPNLLKKLPDSTSPQEFFIQQQTPDGKQKTFKLIKLPANHPLNSVLKTTTTMPQPMTVQVPTPPPPPTIVTQPLPQPAIVMQQPPPLSVPLNQLPPGLIIFTGNNQVAPVLNPPVPGLVTSAVPVTSADAVKTRELAVPEDKDASNLPVECDYGDDEIVELNPLEESKEKLPPTDAELFTSIQEVIHTANFEDITLRNVIDRVAAQYSDFDLTPRHIFMKECVKKIIMGS